VVGSAVLLDAAASLLVGAALLVLAEALLLEVLVGAVLDGALFDVAADWADEVASCAAALVHATMPVLAAPSNAQPAMAANSLRCRRWDFC